MSAFLSSMTQPVLMAVNNASSYTVAASSSVNLSSWNADSLLIVATIADTTLTGFTMTATGGASTASMTTLVGAAGSGSTAALTVSSTAPGKCVYIDVKNVTTKFVGANHTGLAASIVSIVGYPYDSKKQKVDLSGSLSSTASGTGYIVAVSPTTT